MAKINEGTSHTNAHISRQHESLKHRRRWTTRKWKSIYHKICDGSNGCTFLDVVYSHLSQKFNKTGLSHVQWLLLLAPTKSKCYAMLHTHKEFGTEKKMGTAWYRSAHLKCTSAPGTLYALNFTKLWIAAATKATNTLHQQSQYKTAAAGNLLIYLKLSAKASASV